MLYRIQVEEVQCVEHKLCKSTRESSKVTKPFSPRSEWELSRFPSHVLHPRPLLRGVLLHLHTAAEQDLEGNESHVRGLQQGEPLGAGAGSRLSLAIRLIQSRALPNQVRFPPLNAYPRPVLMPVLVMNLIDVAVEKPILLKRFADVLNWLSHEA